jgi:hypothetical protein
MHASTVYVRFSLEKRYTNFLPKVTFLFLETMNIFQSCKNFEKYSGFDSPDSDFCSSETVQDGRTARRPKLFVSARRLQEQRRNPEKLSWVRVSVSMIYVASKLSTMEEQRQNKRFCFGGDITGICVTNPKTVWVRFLVKKLDLVMITFFRLCSTTRSERTGL